MFLLSDFEMSLKSFFFNARHEVVSSKGYFLRFTQKSLPPLLKITPEYYHQCWPDHCAKCYGRRTKVVCIQQKQEKMKHQAGKRKLSQKLGETEECGASSERIRRTEDVRRYAMTCIP